MKHITPSFNIGVPADYDDGATNTGGALGFGELSTRLNVLDSRMMRLDSSQRDFISKEELEPIRKIVYGLVSTILIAVTGALVALVVGSP